MAYTFALAGNQNSGKTTLFNQLTGSNQHVGNWPGKTVEQKTGVCTSGPRPLDVWPFAVCECSAGIPSTTV